MTNNNRGVLINPRERIHCMECGNDTFRQEMLVQLEVNALDKRQLNMASRPVWYCILCGSFLNTAKAIEETVNESKQSFDKGIDEAS